MSFSTSAEVAVLLTLLKVKRNPPASKPSDQRKGKVGLKTAPHTLVIYRLAPPIHFGLSSVRS